MTKDEMLEHAKAFMVRTYGAPLEMDAAARDRFYERLGVLVTFVSEIAPPVEPPAPQNAARGMCRLSNRPACSEYPRCQCGQSALNRQAEPSAPIERVESGPPELAYREPAAEPRDDLTDWRVHANCPTCECVWHPSSANRTPPHE